MHVVVKAQSHVAPRAQQFVAMVGMASKAIYGEDLLAAAGVDYKPYLKMLGERPSVQKVAADRKAATAKA